MSSTEVQHDNAAIVRRVYEAAFAGDATAFAAVMAEDFEEDVPPVLPWGGTHRGADAFMNNVLPLLAGAVDFTSMKLISLAADGEHVAALLTAKSIEGEELWISEHWTMREGKAVHMRVFYHDTTPLLKNAV
ncbi:ketosteroid isomerase-like protein [Rhodococcus sp. 27YEA15]|uniref:nuclear transport factor 2 family protein n=1 Tax=Rhodococcus sp. 27YEA15 TaxID=3156259 RepID=UPI003C7CC525